ncbi:MFS transporter [Vulcanococcus limneticus]|uniref:MFS transporter n=1 Tax=Vulcanococcus limneticus TaxID=2170428 RepID=UPI00398BDCAA
MGSWTVILFACLGAVLGQSGMFIDLPSLPDLAADFRIGGAGAQATIASYALGYGLSQLLWGALADRCGRRPVALVGMLLFAVASLALCVVTGFASFQALRLLQGVGAGCGTSVSRATLRDVFSDRRLAQAMSWVSVCFAGALGFAPFVGGQIAQIAPWRADFLLLAAVAAATAAFLAIALPETRPAEAGQRPEKPRPARIVADYVRLLVDPRFLLPAAICALATGMIAFYDAVSPFDLESGLGLSRTAFGNLSLSLTGAYLVGAIVVNRGVVRLGQGRLLALGAVCALVGPVLMLLAALAGWFSVASVLLPMLPVVVGGGLMIPIGLAMPMQAFPERAGAASALTGFLQQEGSGLFVALGAMLPAARLLPLAMALLAIALVLALLVGVYGRRLQELAGAGGR